MSFCSGITWTCFLVTATACSSLSASHGCDPVWRGMPGYTWTPNNLPACILDRGLLPYETNMVPYFSQFPVISFSYRTLHRWGRAIYRSDIARYGDQWTRQTWWNYRWIAQALAKGEIVPGNDSSVTRAKTKTSDHYRQVSGPILVINPFAADAQNGPEVHSPSTVSPEVGDRSKVMVRFGSIGPQPQRITNPFAAGG
ncbi:hypothetical protein [Thermogutta sp.]|uniref:hypothetical protein n=1 Tax=Thermogutta sp. TaxID=1962930 RepID=UPI003220775C